MKNEKRIEWIYFIRFFGDAFYSSFIALYFNYLGYKGAQLGLLLGVIPIMGILGNLLWGKLCKKALRNLMIIKIMLLIELLLLVPLGFIDNFYILLLLIMGISLLNSPHYSIQDGICIKLLEKKKINYAKIRMFGSIGYFLSTLIGGYIVQWFDYYMIFLLASIAYLIALIIWCFIKVDFNQECKETISFKTVIANRTFIFYLIASMLIIGALNVTDTYTSTYLKELGLKVGEWGIVFGGMLFLEIVTIFIVVKFIKSTNYLNMVIIAAAILTLKEGLMAINLPLYLLVPISLLRGVGWGLLLSSHLNMIKKIVGDNLAIKATSLLNIVLGIFNGTMTYFAPKIYESTSFQLFYLIMSSISLLGLAIMISFHFYMKKNIGKVSNI